MNTSRIRSVLIKTLEEDKKWLGVFKSRLRDNEPYDSPYSVSVREYEERIACFDHLLNVRFERRHDNERKQ